LLHKWTKIKGHKNNNYTGYTYDEVLDLYFAQNRFYDPETHRFTQEDIVKDGNNWYAYCDNSPLNSVDPLGTMNYWKQTDNLLSGIADGIKSYGSELKKSVQNAIPMTYELVKSVVKGNIDLVQLAKAVFKDISGDPWYLYSNRGVLDPYTKVKDAEVYKYGKVTGRVASDIILSLVTGGIGKGVKTYLSSVKATKLIGKLGNASKYSKPYACDIYKQNNLLNKTLNDVKNLKGEVAKKGGITSIKYSPVNPGPLKQSIAETFTGASYTQKSLEANTVFYRVSTNEAGKVGSYMTRTPQMGGMQSQLDLALNPEWGNTAQVVTKVTVPKDTVIYEGTAAPQVINGGAGMLPGGGNQIYIPEVNPKWFK